MKKVLLLLFVPLFIACNNAIDPAENKNIVDKEGVNVSDTIKNKSKLDLFTSKRGSIIKFIDYNLSLVKSKYTVPEIRIRKYMVNNEIGYFYQIVRKGNYTSKTASVEYADLLEALKALEVLKSQEKEDLKSGGDYLENTFVTVDGFEIGYYVVDGASTWVITLDKYGSDNTLYFDNVSMIENTFLEGKNKIEELKK